MEKAFIPQKRFYISEILWDRPTQIIISVQICSHSVCPLQVPILSVWQPDRHAVPDQRSVRSAAAASLHGHVGTPGGRPSMGKTHIETPAWQSIVPCSASLFIILSIWCSGERGPASAEYAGILPALLPPVPQPPPPAPTRWARRPQGLREDEQRQRARGHRVERMKTFLFFINK